MKRILNCKVTRSMVRPFRSNGPRHRLNAAGDSIVLQTPVVEVVVETGMVTEIEIDTVIGTDMAIGIEMGIGIDTANADTMATIEIRATVTRGDEAHLPGHHLHDATASNGISSEKDTLVITTMHADDLRLRLTHALPTICEADIDPHLPCLPDQITLRPKLSQKVPITTRLTPIRHYKKKKKKGQKEKGE